MARKRKNVNPRKARKAEREAAAKKKQELDVAKATGAYVGGKVQEAAAVSDTEQPAQREVPPLKLDDSRPMGYGGAPIPQTERPAVGLDPRDIEEDKATVETAKLFEGEGAPKTPASKIAEIQEKRRQAREERSAQFQPVDLDVAGQEEETRTEGEIKRGASLLDPFGTITSPTGEKKSAGILDPGKIASSGRAEVGLSEYQMGRAESRLAKRSERYDVGSQSYRDLEDAARLEGVDIGEVLGADRPIAEKPEVMDLARRLASKEHEAAGKDPATLDLSNEALYLGPHVRAARVLHYTGLSQDELKGYLGKNSKMSQDRLNEFHETVMNNIRSRKKRDVASEMGLERNEQGELAKDENGRLKTTPVAETQLWQHPTEKEADGFTPKVYKVSDLHPDMVAQLTQHPWGGHQSRQDYEGFQTLGGGNEVEGSRRQAANSVPVVMRFGHAKTLNGQGPWKFNAPPQGFEAFQEEGLISRADKITAAIATGNYRPAKMESETRRSQLLDAFGLSPRKEGEGAIYQDKQMFGGTSYERTQPFDTEDGTKTQVTETQDLGETIQGTKGGLPIIKDKFGNDVALPPRAGRPGTGRSVQVTQGTGGLRGFSSAAEESAKAMAGYTVDTEGQIERGNEAAMEQSRADNRSSTVMNLLAQNPAVGKQFLGAQGIDPEQRMKTEQEMLPGFENFGNVERVRDLKLVGGTLTGRPQPAPRQIMEGPIEGWQARAEAGAATSSSKVIRESVNEPEFGKVSYPARTEDGKEALTEGAPMVYQNTGKPDQRVLRQRAEEEARSGGESTEEVEKPFEGRMRVFLHETEPSTIHTQYRQESDGTLSRFEDRTYSQPTLPFAKQGHELPASAFMSGQIRTLTDAEKGVEDFSQTRAGLNPPRKNFDVGAVGPTGEPLPTAAPRTTITPPSSGQIQLDVTKGKKKGSKRSPAKNAKVSVETEVVPQKVSDVEVPISENFPGETRITGVTVSEPDKSKDNLMVSRQLTRPAQSAAAQPDVDVRGQGSNKFGAAVGNPLLKQNLINQATRRRRGRKS